VASLEAMTPPPRSGGSPRGAGSGDERAASALTGGGPSQLGVQGSMRARDVSRPTEDDVAEAERLVQVSYRPRSQPRPALPGPSGRRPTGPAAQPGGAAGSGGSSPDAS
jgi:hypothetical protein